MTRSMMCTLVVCVTGVMALTAPRLGARVPERVVRAALPPGAIQNVLVIDLENEDFAKTFAPNSPAVYLNSTLLKQGQLVVNYYATSHASTGNYLSQVSGQASTPMINSDCIDLTKLPQFIGGFSDVTPGTDAIDDELYPGQVVGGGCVFPAPTLGSHGARTIGDQLDDSPGHKSARLMWRMYAEDMGNIPARDGGTPDPLGGTDCAHPLIGGVDVTNVQTVGDQYAHRHNPFIYFHSVIDDFARCAEHVVPLGTLTVGINGAADSFEGHFADDFGKQQTTPAFSFITPNVCNDGHDATCVGLNVEGTHAGGLVAADLWLKHWMPMILASPAYRSGKLLVVLTFDEADIDDARACCNERPGPNITNPGFSPVVALFGLQKTPAPGTFPYPGGGQTGAVLFNAKHIVPGSVNSIGAYNHYSALRSYEDLLGIVTGGDDGLGHLGFATAAGLTPFGPDVFNAFPGRR
jgi:phosphatidylinositol-3-phosphatase